MPHRAGLLSRTDVAGSLRRLATEPDPGSGVQELVDVVRSTRVSDDETGLGITDRIAVRLLERGRADVALGVVRDHLAGRPYSLTVRDDRVFAWSRGFDDPRANIPIEVYDVSDLIVLRCAVDEVRWITGSLVIGGFAHFSNLTAERTDVLNIELADGGGRVLAATVRRVRRPDRVRDSGPNHTRLAWSGFDAAFDGNALLGQTGKLTMTATIARGALMRTAHPLPTPAAGLKAALPYCISTGTRPIVIQSDPVISVTTSDAAIGRSLRLRRTPRPIHRIGSRAHALRGHIRRATGRIMREKSPEPTPVNTD